MLMAVVEYAIEDCDVIGGVCDVIFNVIASLFELSAGELLLVGPAS